MVNRPRVFNIVLVAISLAVLICYVLADGVDKILSVFFNCRFFWLLVGFGFMVCYWYLEAGVLNTWLSIFNKRLSFKSSVKNCMLGQFFNNITPSSTGGQPFQLYFLNRCGVGYGVAICSLLVKFVCFQVALALICTVVMFWKFNENLLHNGLFAVLVVAGCAINVAVAFVLILIGLKKDFSVSLINFFIKLFGRLKLIKNVEKKLILAKEELVLFNKSLMLIFNHKMVVFRMLLLSCLQLMFFYSISVVIALALGLNLTILDIFKIIAGAVCVHVSSSFIPLPGAMGGAEFSYHVVYGETFVAEKLAVAVLLWRIYTFYLPVVIGLFFSKNLFSKT